MTYAEVSSLPAAVCAALKAVSYGRKDIKIRASESVSLAVGGSAGRKGFAILVNLTTGQHAITWGSWGGANMFNPDNAVDLDHRQYQLPADGCAITGSIGGTEGTFATIHIPASMVDRMLPAPPADLSEEEKNGLYAHKAIKGGQYRREALRRAKVRSSTIDGLVERGLLSRNKAGATQITTAGKNSLGDFRAYM